MLARNRWLLGMARDRGRLKSALVKWHESQGEDAGETPAGTVKRLNPSNSNKEHKVSYKLMTALGEVASAVPGELGGHRGVRIYGRLDCRRAAYHIARGHYVRHRVFFANEEDAQAAGYRPCFICMRDEYNAWKTGEE